MQSEGWSSQRLYRPYLRASLIVAVTLGFSTGAAILIMPLLGMERSLTWVTHGQSHGIAQLFGWAGLFVMGFAFHVVPRFFSSATRYPTPQRVSMWLTITGLLLRFTGQSMYKSSVADPLLVSGGIALAAGLMLFAWTLFDVVRGSTDKSGPAELWMISGIFWSATSGILHLAIVLRMSTGSSPLGYALWNEALIYAALFGFVGSFIFGVSARAIRGFLVLKPAHLRVNRAALAIVNSGLVVLVIVRFAEFDQTFASIGLMLIASGALLYVLALRILEPAAGVARRFTVGYRRYGTFIRVAYAWLVIGCLMLVVTALDSSGATDLLPPGVALPVLHVLTMGFVTTLIMSAASRLVPIFEGSDIQYPRLLDATFVLITASTALRILFGYSTSELSVRALGASGGLGLLAIILFAVVMFQALSKDARTSYAARAAAFGQVKFHTVKYPNRRNKQQN